MKRHLVTLAIGAALLPTFATTTPASATNACEQNVNITFTPAITAAPGIGTGTLTNNYVCAGLDTFGSNKLAVTWAGDCNTAAIALPGWTGTLYNGSVLVLTRTPGGVGVAAYYLDPNFPCAESAANGVGVGVFVV